jgi:hypothetical protein
VGSDLQHTVIKVKLRDHSRYVEMGAKHFKLLTEMMQIEGDWDKLSARLASARKRINVSWVATTLAWSARVVVEVDVGEPESALKLILLQSLRILFRSAWARLSTCKNETSPGQVNPSVGKCDSEPWESTSELLAKHVKYFSDVTNEYLKRLYDWAPISEAHLKSDVARHLHGRIAGAGYGLCAVRPVGRNPDGWVGSGDNEQAMFVRVGEVPEVARPVATVKWLERADDCFMWVADPHRLVSRIGGGFSRPNVSSELTRKYFHVHCSGKN